MTCKSCGGVNFETYEAEGNKVCIGCGTVQEENTIVSELAFADNAFGGHSLVGTMVGFGQSGAKLRTGLGSFTNSSNNELTITKANELARKFGTALYLADHYVDKAMNFFKLLLIHNFSRGRKSEVTIAVCLYAACRVNQTTHMLIDFSDLAEASVFTLGSAFVKLVGLLNLKSEVALVDPSLYISRFAACLGFGDKQHKVAETAIRLVTRMKRDWMTTGRRPAGICGASLLIASRIHHFNRNINQIVKIVRMSSDTVKKRLEEFASTETGKMTVDDFHNINLEAFEDPPAYKRARKAESLAERALLVKKKEETVEANLSNFNGKVSNEVIEIDKYDRNLNKSIKISNIEVEKGIGKEANNVDEESHQKTSSEMSLDEAEEEINLKEEINNYIAEPKTSIVKIKT
ncbi:cyclin-like protein, partial [Neoconidiobolus thromboides FSU 785]